MQYDLSLEDVNVCKTKNAKSNQLAFGVMLSFFKRYTQFPMATEANISSELILQVAKSLDIDPLFITTFDWSGRNAKKYRQEIRKYLGYRVTNAEDIASIINYLVDNLIPRQLSDSVLLEQTRLYFSKNKIEIVSTQQLEGYILLANQKFEQQFFDKILCLHLLQVCMVYINTLIIQSILSGSHWQNKFTPKDYRALTPLFSGHINPYGLFPLDFSKRLSIGLTI